MKKKYYQKGLTREIEVTEFPFTRNKIVKIKYNNVCHIVYDKLIYQPKKTIYKVYYNNKIYEYILPYNNSLDEKYLDELISKGYYDTIIKLSMNKGV